MDSNKKAAGFSDAESTEEEEVVTKGQSRKDTSSSESKLDGMTTLLPIIRRRVHALKNLQMKVTTLDAAFYMEVHALEVKYMKLYYPFLDKRAEVITGRYEPNDEECQWESDSEEHDAITSALQNAQINEKKESQPSDSDIKGIPSFWLTIFKNVSLLSEMVQEHDEPILEHLEDIKVIMLEKDPMGFILEFHFAKNEYFTNTILTKEYHMKCQPEPEHPFDFEGPEIFKCKGCAISWCKDKNVTVKVVRKKQKHKSRGSVRTIIKTVPTDSFFNFFDPPELPANQTMDVADDIKNLLTSDFEIGHYIRERVVPFAVLLFTGEGLDEEEDYEEEEDEEEEGSSEEEESSAVEEEKTKKKENPQAKKRASRQGAVRGVRHSSTTNDESNEEEIKEANHGRKGAAPANAVPKDDQSSPGTGPQANPIECKQQ